VVGTSVHVLTRPGVHHPRDRGLPGARLRPHRLLRGRHRRAARLDGAAHRDGGATAATVDRARHAGDPAADARTARTLTGARNAEPMRRLRRTKIVATLGPASGSREMIARLFEAGADVFRVNMSHTSHDRMRELVAAIRSV